MDEEKPVRYCQARKMGGHFCLSPPGHEDDHTCTCGRRWPRGEPNPT